MAKNEFDAAVIRATRRQHSTPAAMRARYDRNLGRVIIQLRSGLDLMLDPRKAEGLTQATAGQLSEIEITPSGFGLHFPKLDADLYLPALLEGVLGSKKWMASRLGASGGKRTSVQKKRSSRANGKLGGRPRKAAS
jgi:hypothetical protein